MDKVAFMAPAAVPGLVDEPGIETLAAAMRGRLVQVRDALGGAA